MAKKKPKVHMLPAKKGKGPPHTHMMEGAQERDVPPGMMAGRQARKVKKH